MFITNRMHVNPVELERKKRNQQSMEQPRSQRSRRSTESGNRCTYVMIENKVTAGQNKGTVQSTYSLMLQYIEQRYVTKSCENGASLSRFFFIKSYLTPLEKNPVSAPGMQYFVLDDERPAYRDDLSRARIEDDKQKYIQQVEYFLL